MKCKYCRNELTDFNDFAKDDPYRKKMGFHYSESDNGMVYFCNNKNCKNYNKMLVKGFDFKRKSLWMTFWHFFYKLSTKIEYRKR